MRRTSWRNNCSVAVNRGVLYTVVETIGDIRIFWTWWVDLQDMAL